MTYGGAVLPLHIQKLRDTYSEIRTVKGPAEAERLLRSTRMRERTRALIRELGGVSGPLAVSLDLPARVHDAGPENLSLHDAIADESQGIGAIETDDLLSTFQEFAQERLNCRERLIVSWLHPHVLSFPDGRQNMGAPKPSLGEVAIELGITRERVRQIFKSIRIRFRLYLCARREEWGY